MCGILGGIATGTIAAAGDGQRLKRAIDLLTHRGPDDWGQYVSTDGCAFLGHRRLSIIDLAGGHQPITDESRRIHFCYNGEIYNYRSLRAELIGRGHQFRTHTDGEVVLHLYQEDSSNCMERLQGMFAIALYDENKRQLTLIRDRNGIKPLYYYHDGDCLLFASEIKAILALLSELPVISGRALHEYLRWKYIPAPLTIYDKIYKLPAAHILQARIKDDRSLAVDMRSYWDPDYSGDKLTDETEAVELLDERLRAAVKSHLESDVEVGALLSGGVDSSLVVALAAIVSGKRIRTFSVGFREPGFDELPYARKLAQRYNTEHHEEYVDLDPMSAVEKLVRHFDEPFGDSSALACYRVCEVASRKVKVALTGDGGDETFAGYKLYSEVLGPGQRDNRLLRLVHSSAFAAASALFSPEAKFLRSYHAKSHRLIERHEERRVICTPWLTRRLLTEQYRHLNGDSLYDPLRRHGLSRQWSPVEIAQYADLRMLLPGDMLTKVDRTSMACSLECRVPLLDHAVTEFSTRLSTDLRIKNGTRKYLLKKLARRYVPQELLYRKKMGFRIPIRRWFKQDLLHDTAELLLDGILIERGILDRAGVQWILRSQQRPWMNLSTHLWSLLFLEHWARIYLPGS